MVDVEKRSGLVERSSREGFEENDHFRRLRRLVTELLSREIEPKRYLFRKKAGLDRGRGDTFETAYRTARFDWARALVKDLPPRQRDTAVRILDEQSDKLTRQLEVLEEKQSVLGSKVTLGLIVGEVLHEGRKPVVLIQREAGRLSRRWSELCDDTAEAREFRQQGPAILRDLGQSAERLRHLFAMLEPLAGGKRGKESYYSANQVVIDSVALFATELADAGILVTRKADPHVSDVLGYRQDLTAALANLIDNSIYWLTYAKSPNPEISFEVAQDKNGCAIIVSDNGPGIPSEFRDEVFDVGFSLKSKGTGLGLSIAREAIQRSGGSIDLVESSIGAQFLVKLPYRRA
jgi:signal transduction histidine kinase